MSSIDDLRFDNKNFNKHTEFGMSALEKSLRNYGAGRSILVDKDNNIIAGNGIAEMAGQIGITKTRVVETVGDELVVVRRTDISLDSKKGRGMALADNATAAVDLKWDEDLLIDEAEKWELSFGDWGLDFSTEPHDYYGDERERTYNSVNLGEYDAGRADNKYGFPVLLGCDFVPEKIIGFNEAKTASDNHVGIHFFIDDYQFERIWNNPKKYIDLMKKFDCIFTPDFSLYTDMPLAMKIWNIYRSRLVGQIMEDNEILVIPTLSWAGKDTLDFAFDGLPRNSTYAVSTVGVMQSNEAKTIWANGMERAIDVLDPKTILLYGPEIDFDWSSVSVVNFGARAFNQKHGIIISNGDVLEEDQQ